MTNTDQHLLPSSKARQLVWLLGLRLGAVTSMVLPYLLYRPGSPSGEGALLLYFLAGAAYVMSLVFLASLRIFKTRLELNALLQLLGDLVLISGLVYYFGGASSAFSLLYLIVIAVAATLLRRPREIMIANLAWILYAGIVFGLSSGWLPTANVQALETGAQSGKKELAEICASALQQVRAT